MARVLVLDGHSAAALAFTRSLGRAGHWVAVGANRGDFAPATLSRFCRLKLEYPISTQDTAGFISAVASFASDNGIDLVVPVTDWTVTPLSRYREEFVRICKLALPPQSAVDLTSDKYCTIELAKSIGIPTPRTWLVRSADDLNQVSDLPFPLVVKDRFSARWVGDRAIFGSVAYAYSREEASRIIDHRVQQAGDVLIQNFVAGVGVGFSCFALRGECRVPFQWRRIRETDPKGSGSSCRRSVPLDGQLRDFSTRLITSAGFEGIAMVEYKSCASGPVLMEINGRPWGSMQLAISSGIDYPRYVVEWYVDGAVPPAEIRYDEAITCRRMTAELTHLEHLRKGKPANWPLPYASFWATLAKVSIPWYPGMRYDDISFTDPHPGAAEIAHWFGIRLKKKKRS